MTDHEDPMIPNAPYTLYEVDSYGVSLAGADGEEVARIADTRLAIAVMNLPALRKAAFDVCGWIHHELDNPKVCEEYKADIRRLMELCTPQEEVNDG